MTLREIFNKVLDFDLTLISDLLFYGLIIFGFFLFYPYIIFMGVKHFSENFKKWPIYKKIGMSLALLIMIGLWLLVFVLHFFY